MVHRSRETLGLVSTFLSIPRPIKSALELEDTFCTNLRVSGSAIVATRLESASLANDSFVCIGIRPNLEKLLN